MLAARAGAAIGLMLVSTTAVADCACRCLNGEVQVLCTIALDFRPVCSPTSCSPVPPSIRPFQVPSVPAIGASGCVRQKMLNPYTRQFEWRQICR